MTTMMTHHVEKTCVSRGEVTQAGKAVCATMELSTILFRCKKKKHLDVFDAKNTRVSRIGGRRGSDIPPTVASSRSRVQGDKLKATLCIHGYGDHRPSPRLTLQVRDNSLGEREKRTKSPLKSESQILKMATR